MPATPDAIAAAADLLQEGGLVAFPTETVYGLGADATQDRAVARIYAAKGRPEFNPLIVHLWSAHLAAEYAILDARAEALAARFWPGPLTLVVARAPGCPLSLLVSAGLDTVALRVPAHPVAQALLRRAHVPVAAPSANASGRLSPTRAEHVIEGLGAAVDVILDGGPTPGGLESTVLDMTADPPLLLRPGLVTQAEIEAVLGREIALPDAGGPAGNDAAPRPSPGMLASHYAPRALLRLGAGAAAPGEALLAFGPLASDPAASPAPGAMLNLSPAGDLVEAAANLFAYLHRLDSAAPRAIAVMPIPDTGLGAAINDRLRRAAAPRDFSAPLPEPKPATGVI